MALTFVRDLRQTRGGRGTGAAERPQARGLYAAGFAIDSIGSSGRHTSPTALALLLSQ